MIKECLGEQMEEHAISSILAYARRFAVSVGMDDEKILNDLSRKLCEFIQESFDNAPEEHIRRADAIRAATRFLDE